MVLHDATNAEGLFLGLRWSVNYRIAVRSIGDRRVAVEAGVRMQPEPEKDAQSAVDLQPGFMLRNGQTILSPWLIAGTLGMPSFHHFASMFSPGGVAAMASL